MKKISFENVTKKFQTNFWEKTQLALDDVSFSIKEGEVVGFLGANGAGKTTSMKVLMGFIREDFGQVLFHGFQNNSRNGFLKVLGYLPEKTYVYQHLTGREFLNYMGELQNVSPSQIKLNIVRWSERLAIAHALDGLVKNYSKGMQQRLCFLAALLINPEILVLDEPLSGLDPLGRREFKDIFLELNRNQGTTVFFSSHVVSDVEEVCSKVLFIEKGKMLYAGEIDQLMYENSDNKYKIKYFENNQMKIELIQDSEKKQRLIELLSKNVQIVELEKNKMSLESIIYKVKPRE